MSFAENLHVYVFSKLNIFRENEVFKFVEKYFSPSRVIKLFLLIYF
jgi:hypothetical protein